MSAHHQIGKRPRITGLLLVGGLLLGAAAHAQNAAPVISGTPGSSAVPGQTYQFQPTASDPDGDILRFGVSGRPGWMLFNKRTGRIWGKPTAKHLGKTYEIRIAASDGSLSAVLPPFKITVAASAPPTTPPPTPIDPVPPTNRTPSISGSPPATVVEGALYGFVPTATDPDGDPLVFSISGKPSWATFNASSGLLSGIPPTGAAATYSPVQISVSDGKAAAALPPFGITVTKKPNSSPVIWGIPATTVNAGEPYLFRPSASDVDGQPLQFAVERLPAWASFNTATGTLSGTPAFSQAGTYSGIVISASDGQTSTPLAAFSITVVAVNTPPTLSGAAPTSATASKAYSFTPTASDVDGQPLVFSIENKPAWASFNTATGRLSGTPTNAHAGTQSGIAISVSDGVESTAMAPFSITVTVVNTPPTITGTPSESGMVGQAYNFLPYASDLEGQALTFSIANKPAWASFDASTGRLSGTPTAADVGTGSGIAISVSDGQASTALPAFSITVLAATPGSATVSWTPPTSFEDGSPITNLAGFRVVYGNSAAALSSAVTVASAVITSATIEDLAPGTWYFAVKAYTTADVESDLSTVASKTIR